MKKATWRDIAAIARLLALAFNWTRTGGTTPPESIDHTQDEERARRAFLVHLVSAAAGVALGQFHYRPGATVQVVNLNRTRAAMVVVTIVGTITVTAVGLAILAMSSVALNWMAGILLMLVVAALVRGYVHHRRSGAGREEELRRAGLVLSKRPRNGDIATKPPARPRWKITDLAGDPREKDSSALIDAVQVATDVIPAGDVFEAAAGTARLLRLYKRYGFIQWHPRSSAVWRRA